MKKTDIIVDKHRVARVPNLDGKFADAGAAVARQFADISYRGANNSSRAFGMAIRQIESGYNKFFADAVEQYRLSTANIVWTQDMSWLAYTRRLGKQGLKPESRMFGPTRRAVVASVQKSGIPVPDNWRPSDRRTFDRAVKRQVETKALQEFRKGVANQLGVQPAGSDITPDMSLAAFLRSAFVRSALQEILHLPRGNYVLVSGGSVAAMEKHYKDHVYSKILTLTAQQLQEQLALDAKHFADGGSVEAVGKNYVRSMLIPSVALVLSVMGALVHFWKLVFFMTEWGTGLSFRKAGQKSLAILLLSLSLLLLFSRMPTTDITTQDLYLYFKQQVTADSSVSVNHLFARASLGFSDAVIHAQPVLYALFEWTRVHLMRGFDFGYVDPRVTTQL